jgi:peroxiredoxin
MHRFPPVLLATIAAILALAIAGCAPAKPPVPSAALTSAQNAVAEAAGPVSDLLMKAGFQVPKTGVSASEFTLASYDGKKVSLSSYKGSLVFLSFWATWCGPCKQELPSVEALYEKLKDKGFTVLAVDLMEDTGVVGSFIKANGMTFPVLLDSDGKVGGMYDAGSIPTNYLIDRKGNILARIVGYDGVSWTSPERVALFEKLLAN